VAIIVIVNTQKTLPITVYTAICVECGIHGPDAFSEEDANLCARKEFWKKTGDDYTCPDPIHVRDKSIRDFLQHAQEFEQKREQALEELRSPN